jgi:hypothetical protein
LLCHCHENQNCWEAIPFYAMASFTTNIIFMKTTRTNNKLLTILVVLTATCSTLLAQPSHRWGLMVRANTLLPSNNPQPTLSTVHASAFWANRGFTLAHVDLNSSDLR